METQGGICLHCRCIWYKVMWTLKSLKLSNHMVQQQHLGSPLVKERLSTLPLSKLFLLLSLFLLHLLLLLLLLLILFLLLLFLLNLLSSSSTLSIFSSSLSGSCPTSSSFSSSFFFSRQTERVMRTCPNPHS